MANAASAGVSQQALSRTQEELAASKAQVEALRAELKAKDEAHAKELEGARATSATALHAVRLESQLAEERTRSDALQKELASTQQRVVKIAEDKLAQEENSELELARMGSMLNAEQRATTSLKQEIAELKARCARHDQELELAALPANRMAEQVERLQTQLQDAKENVKGLEQRLQAKQAHEGSLQDNLVAEIARLGKQLEEETSRRMKAEHQLVLESSDV